MNASSTFKQGYALLIGVNDHQVPVWSLPAVAKDLDALYAVLVHPERCAYPPDHVRVLRGGEATRAAILAGLDWLQEKVADDPSGNATAVVYYSGHGWRNEAAATPTYYLIPYDTVRQGVLPKTSTALRADEFAEAITALTPQRLFVVLDCCHAAGLDVKELGSYVPAALPADLFFPAANTGVTAPASGDKGLEQLAMGHGRAILSSSQGIERSYIRTDQSMSIFTFHLIEALTGHAQPQNGATEVLISDILSYVYRTVPDSAAAQDKQQHPDYKLTGNFPIALLLGGKGLTPGQAAPDPRTVLVAQPPPTYQITNSGSGAVAIGSGVAAGERGVAIGGDVSGGNIITGDSNTIRQVRTGGGSYIEGSVNAGRDFVGRDKHIHGDEVRGDYRAVFDQRGQRVKTQYNVAGDLNFSEVRGRQAGITELEKLLTTITSATQAGILSTDVATDTEYQVKKALLSANKPDGHAEQIVKYLAEARALVANVAGAEDLGRALGEAILMVQRVF